jgi:hypothetical protein
MHALYRTRFSLPPVCTHTYEVDHLQLYNLTCTNVPRYGVYVTQWHLPTAVGTAVYSCVHTTVSGIEYSCIFEYSSVLRRFRKESCQ